MIKTTKMQVLELADPEGRDIREIVTAALTESRSLRHAGERLGVSGACLCRWTQRMGIRFDRRLYLAETECAA